MRKKTKKKIFSQTIFLMTASVSIEYFGWGFFDPFFSIFANEILNNLFFLGLLIALKNFIALLIVIIASQTVKETSPRNMAIFSKWILLFAIAFYLSAGFQSSTVMLIIAIIFNAIGQVLRNVSSQALLMRNTKKNNASKILGIDFAVKNFAWILGMPLGGFLIFYLALFLKIEAIQIIYLLLIPLMISIFISIFPLKKLPFKSTLKKTLQRTEDIILHGKIFSAFFDNFSCFSPQLSFSLILFFLLQLIERMVTIFIPLLAISLNLEFWQIGILTALLFLPYIFSFAFSFLADRLERLSIVIFGLLFSIFPLVFLSITESPLYIAIFASLISFSLAMIQPANLGIIASLSSKKEKEHMAGLEIFFQKIGTIFGSIVLGFIAEKFSVNIVFLIIAFLSLSFAFFAILVKMHAHKKNIHHKHNIKFFEQLSHHHIFHHAHRLT